MICNNDIISNVLKPSLMHTRLKALYVLNENYQTVNYWVLERGDLGGVEGVFLGAEIFVMCSVPL